MSKVDLGRVLGAGKVLSGPDDGDALEVKCENGNIMLRLEETEDYKVANLADAVEEFVAYDPNVPRREARQ